MSGRNTVKKDLPPPVQSQFLLYQTEVGQTRIEVRHQDETFWMTQTTPQNITTYLKAIYTESELEALATCKD